MIQSLYEAKRRVSKEVNVTASTRPSPLNTRQNKVCRLRGSESVCLSRKATVGHLLRVLEENPAFHSSKVSVTHCWKHGSLAEFRFDLGTGYEIPSCCQFSSETNNSMVAHSQRWSFYGPMNINESADIVIRFMFSSHSEGPRAKVIEEKYVRVTETARDIIWK